MVSNPFQDGLTVDIGGDAGGLTSELDKAMQGIGGLETAVIGLGSALAGLSAGGLAASVSEFANFEGAMTESQAIMGDLTDGEMAAMEDAAREVGRTTTFAAEDGAEAFYFLASAGMDAEQSVAAMGDVAQFAQAGAFDMATATDLATDAQSALGMASEDAAENQENLNRVMDTLVGANQLANASVEEFSSSLTNKAAAAMEGAGVEIEEGAAVLSNFADQGLKGNRAGTILARTIEGLQSSAQENSEAFEDMGISVYDSEGNMRSMQDITEDLEDGLEGMSTEQRNAALQQLGLNERAQQGVNLMTGNSEAMREYEEELRNAGGASEEVAENQLQSLNAQWDLFKSQIQDVLLEIGGALAPALETLLGHVSGLVDRFAAWNRETEGVGGALTLVTGLVTGTVAAVAGLASQLGFAASTTSALSGALGVLTGPIGLITTAVIALGAAYMTNFGGIRDSTHEVVGVLREALQPAIDWLQSEGVPIVQRIADAVVEFVDLAEPYIEEFVDLIADGLIFYIETLATVWETVFGVISEVLTTVWDTVLEPFLSWFTEAIVDNFEEPIEEAQETFGVWADKVGELVGWLEDEVIGPFADWFEDKIDSTLGKISEWWDEHGETVEGIVEPLFDALETIVETAIENITDAFSAFFALLRGDWETFEENITEIWDRTVGLVIDAAEELWDKVTGWIDDLFEDVTGVFGDLYDDVTETVSELMSDILETITETDVEEAVKGIVEDAIDWIEDTAVGDFLQAGKDAVDAIVEGIKDAPDAIKDAVEDVAGPVLDLLPSSDADEGPFSNLTGAGEAVPETIASGASGSLDAVKDSLQGMQAPLPVGAASGSGGGDTILNLEIDARGADSPQQVRRAGDDVMNKLKREFDSGL